MIHSKLMIGFDAIKGELKGLENSEKVITFRRVFKPSENERLKFFGVPVPTLRKIIKKYSKIPLTELQKLLEDEYHECNIIALLFLIYMFNKEKSEEIKKLYFNFYCDNIKYINTWDLVDLSAPYIVGNYLIDKNRDILYKFAKEADIWKQRIAIVSTYCFIKQNDLVDTIEISKILLNTKDDLIQKAVGWMLREAGKKDFDAEYNFLLLNDNYKNMPRTMLRYAIEKFPESLRLNFLKGNI